MKVFDIQQIRAWDNFTLEEQRLSSWELMERASQAFVEKFVQGFSSKSKVFIFCGRGNNGGDGLAIARLLRAKDYEVEAWILPSEKPGSPDFENNLARLQEELAPLELQSGQDFSFLQLTPSGLIIDALFGSGLNRPLEGLAADVVRNLNQLNLKKISVDLPSGLFADASTPAEYPVFQADYTFSFQSPKLAFFQADAAPYVGHWDLIDIGLSAQYAAQSPSSFHYLTLDKVQSGYKKRKKFSHKGTYGHCLMFLGSYGKVGAAILAARASLKSGAGLVSLRVPRGAYEILQTTVPEAMCLPDPEPQYLSEIPELSAYSALGIGCGIGQHRDTREMLEKLLSQWNKPLVLDADALNILSYLGSEALEKLPPDSILTPHPKEFARLVGASKNSFETLEKAQYFAQVYKVYVVLKGAHSLIACPDGEVFFNSTGNPGMATAGSGDVLTGIITGLFSQGYSAQESALMGVFLHGKAADLAIHEQESEESLVAGDIVQYLGKAFKLLQKKA